VVIVDPQLSMLMNLGCMANEVEPQLEPREARKKRLQIYSILPRWHVCGWMVFGKFCKFCLPNCVHVCGCVCGCVCVCAGNFVIVEHLSWLQKLGHNHRAMERKGESAITALIFHFVLAALAK